ncbi:MAG: ABC transporter permease [Planctomycetia bacterium]|nr:ABC transporter permease [Planctomycetia bacterium]
MLIRNGKSTGGVSFGSREASTLTTQDAEQIKKQCSAVAAVSPVVRVRNQVIYGSHNWVPMQIYGVTPDYLDIRDWTELAEGEPFTDRDVLSGNKVCLIGTTLVRELFQGESPIDHDIRIQNVSLRVVGVLARKGVNAIGMDRDDTILLPWPVADASLRGAPGTAATALPHNSVDHIMVRTADATDARQAEEQIAALLRARHKQPTAQDADFSFLNLTEMEKALPRR